MVIQSGIASLCGFMVARVRAPRQQMTVPGNSCCQLINFISRPGGFPDPAWQLKLSKATSNKTCDSSFGECWHRQRYIVATRWCESTAPARVFNEQRGLLQTLPTVRGPRRSVSLHSRAATHSGGITLARLASQNFTYYLSFSRPAIIVQVLGRMKYFSVCLAPLRQTIWAAATLSEIGGFPKWNKRTNTCCQILLARAHFKSRRHR